MEEVELSSDRFSDGNPLRKMDKQTNPSKQRSVSLIGLFAAADKADYLLMFLGSVGACIHGGVLPVFFVVFGRMIDSLGHLAKNPQQQSARVSEYALYLVYLGLVLFISAWIGVAFWTRTGERQTARLRMKYLQSVLNKDINFFDTEARDTNIIFHISSC